MAKITYEPLVGFPEEIPHYEKSAWASFIVHRSPEFKVHTSKGLAHSALSYHGLMSPMALYELVDGTWIKNMEYIPPKECPQCGRKIEGYGRNQLGLLEREPRIWAGGRPVCNNCVRAEDQARRDAQAEQQKRRQYEELRKEFDN